ncbi:hypothetical protein AVEN_193081-1 [Araneus ventricosus]|uniref:Uncharacterized protein n=1 Tax=Araneus ventricosus TaxID=182803 RepID=A0A4Y2AZV3_ARAVE|nr:hypothetical protein AVEN_193081-1 [Araneus ventricosus]
MLTCVPGFTPPMVRRRGLMEKTRLQGRRVPGSAKVPPCIWPWWNLNLMSWAKRPLTGKVKKLGERVLSQVSYMWRWPLSGKVSASDQEGSRFETRFHCISAVYGA